MHCNLECYIMDAYLRYNQIRMHPNDEQKMVFMTDDPSYCYKIMPFGLKNVLATYHKLMDEVFIGQIGRNVEVYVDNMVTKTLASGDHCKDFEEIFA